MTHEKDEKRVRNISYGLLHVGLSRTEVTMSYAGNMGHGMRQVDRDMEEIGLFPTDEIRGLPSFTESGWPDYLWEASVRVADLPDELLAKVYDLAVRHAGATGTDVATEGSSSTDALLKVPEGVVAKARECLGRYEELDELRNSPGATDAQVSRAQGECVANALRVVMEAIVAMG